MITDADLTALSSGERSVLLERLLAITQAGNTESGRRRARVRFLVIVTAACVVLIPWTILLALTLPAHHTSDRWNLTWVGFDIALVTCLARTAWLAYQRRYAVALWAVLTGTLLACDSWFDITTASGGVELAGSVVTAVIAEIPLVILLFYAAHRVMTADIERSRAAAGAPDQRVRLSKHQVPGTQPR